jgi:hypothetical protein
MKTHKALFSRMIKRQTGPVTEISGILISQLSTLHLNIESKRRNGALTIKSKILELANTIEDLRTTKALLDSWKLGALLKSADHSMSAVVASPNTNFIGICHQ